MTRLKATHQQTRAHNESLILRTLFDRGPISRAAVARMTDLTRTTVGDVVENLLASGIAHEVGRGPSPRGKAPILLEIVEDARLVVGLDLSEPAFVGALVDLRGHLRRVIVREAADGGASALDTAMAIVDELIATATRPVLGIGIATPGLVDTARGTIIRAVNLTWENVALAAAFEERYGLPTQIANDARAVATGEELFGSSIGSGNLVAVKVGTGIGAGIILRGELFHGDGFGAGEIGHVSVVAGGLVCRCGAQGCLETVASSSSMLRLAAEAASLAPASPIGRIARTSNRLVVSDLTRAMALGDQAVAEIVADAGRFLGSVIADVIATLNVRRIVLFGTATELGEPWVEAVRAGAAARSYGALYAQTQISIGQRTEDAVVRGAVALLMSHELGFMSVR